MSARVLGLHKLVFDAEVFERDAAGGGGGEEYRAQYRVNWGNAWLVVVELDEAWDGSLLRTIGPGDRPGLASNQSPWNEQVLEGGPGRTVVAFYLHQVDGKKSLWFRGERVPLPAVTEGAAELFERVPYRSPD